MEHVERTRSDGTIELLKSRPSKDAFSQSSCPISPRLPHAPCCLQAREVLGEGSERIGVVLTYEIFVLAALFLLDGGLPSAVGVVGPSPATSTTSSSKSGGQNLSLGICSGWMTVDCVVGGFRMLLSVTVTPLKSSRERLRANSVSISCAYTSTSARVLLRDTARLL